MNKLIRSHFETPTFSLDIATSTVSRLHSSLFKNSQKKDLKTSFHSNKRSRKWLQYLDPILFIRAVISSATFLVHLLLGLWCPWLTVEKNISPFLFLSKLPVSWGWASNVKKSVSSKNGTQITFGIKISWGGPSSPVKLILKGKHFQLSPKAKSHIEEKLGKAIKNHTHLVREVDARLSVRGGELGKGKRLRRCEVTLFTKKHGVLRAEVDSESLYASIDLVSSIMQRQLRKIKEKDSDHGRHMKGFSRLNVRDHGSLRLAMGLEEEVPIQEDTQEGMINEIVSINYCEMPTAGKFGS